MSKVWWTFTEEMTNMIIISIFLILGFIFIVFILHNLDKKITVLSKLIEKSLTRDTPTLTDKNSEYLLHQILEELEQINFYRDFPDGDFYEHKRKVMEQIRNPDSLQKLFEIERKLKNHK